MMRKVLLIILVLFLAGFAHAEVVTPAEDPMPGPNFPEIRYTLTGESVIIEGYWDTSMDEDDYCLMLIVDGVQVDNPCMIPRCDEDYLVVVTVYAVCYGYDRTYDSTREIIVPALEKNRFDVNGDSEVNISDVNFLIDRLVDDVNDNRYDVNGDGELNVADINSMIDYILNGV